MADKEMSMNPNELPQDIQNAACALTDAVLSAPLGKVYLSAVAHCSRDPQALTLEKHLMGMCADLIGRQ